jgi:hypothetical protein
MSLHDVPLLGDIETGTKKTIVEGEEVRRTHREGREGRSLKEGKEGREGS